MGDHVTVNAEKLMKTAWEGSSTTQNHVAIPIEKLNASFETEKEEKPETEEKGECRYCQEEDFISKLESPCNCTGSLKYIHRSCIDKWYSARGFCVLCEICRKAYPDYYPLPEIISSDDEDQFAGTDEIREETWTIPGTNTQIQSPLVVAERAANSLSASMNKDFMANWRRPTVGMIFGMSLVVLMAVLIIKDTVNCVPPKEDKFNRFMYLTVVTISVLTYIMSWVFQCQAYFKEEREREMELERERRV